MNTETKIREAAESVLLGESLRRVAVGYREALLHEMGFDPEDAPDDLFVKEKIQFINQVCRHLGDRHAGDRRAAAALADWVQHVDEYDAYDALLSHFQFESRGAVLRKAQMLFPGPLTSHWECDAEGR